MLRNQRLSNITARSIRVGQELKVRRAELAQIEAEGSPSAEVLANP